MGALDLSQVYPVWTSHKMGKSVMCITVPGVRTVSRESESQDSPGSCRHEDKSQ